MVLGTPGSERARARSRSYVSGLNAQLSMQLAHARLDGIRETFRRGVMESKEAFNTAALFSSAMPSVCPYLAAGPRRWQGRRVTAPKEASMHSGSHTAVRVDSKALHSVCPHGCRSTACRSNMNSIVMGA